MSDLIERLRDKARLRAAHGLTGWVLAEEALLAQAADEIERLTAEQQHEAEQVPSLKRTIRDLCAERDELRRQLDPMGEYASAEELIAALHAEKAEDDAMKQDARRYRWLRGEHKRVDPICAVIWKRNGDRNGSEWVNTANIDAEIDAAMGASNE